MFLRNDNVFQDPDLWRKVVKDSNSAHPYNPNAEFDVDNGEHEMYWLQFADFYDWPHITQVIGDDETFLMKLIR